MNNKKSSLSWILIPFISLSVLFLITVMANVALASPDQVPVPDQVAQPAQQVVTPTTTLQMEPTSTISFSLANLGYGETTLKSPFGTAEYSFRLPENWVTEADGLLVLDMSYTYSQLTPDEVPALLGDLSIIFDNQTLQVISIRETSLENYQLRIVLPASLIRDFNRPRHILQLKFEAGYICNVPHRAKLVVYPTSFITLNYKQAPLELNLARYPRPFYQQAFGTTDRVRFVLPSHSTAAGMSDIMSVAAKLGDLASNRVAISATTDIELASATNIDEHLFVIGQPQDNQLIPLLNELTDLPVSLHQQQLDFAMQGPMVVAPGDVITYTFTVTNSLGQDVAVSLVDRLPTYTRLLTCTPNCIESNRVITWTDQALTPAAKNNFTLTLQVADVLTGTILENTVTLLENDLGPVNANTMLTTIVEDSLGNQAQTLLVNQGDYFFVYNNLAVDREDGIIQEIVSPWNKDRAILMVTGLSEESLRKASQTMSSETRLPGMSGVVALVQVFLPAGASEDMLAGSEFTLADLGYPSEVVQGVTPGQLNYYFDIPSGWQLTDEAAIELYFSHSQLITYKDSGMKILLNREPVASVALSDQTAGNGTVKIDLANKGISGQTNRLSVEVGLSIGEGACVDPNSGLAWLLVHDHSKISLAHVERNNTLELDLNNFPSPFHLTPSLTDLLFVLPDMPTTNEWEKALRLAATLGDAAGDKTLTLNVVSGNDLPVDLRAYNLIAIGRPSRNILLQQVNLQLPQPFRPGTDEIEQHLDDIVFRLPPDISLGYLQLMASPWNEERALLAITGTTEQAVDWATDVLTVRRWSLNSGNLALVKNFTVDTFDTQKIMKKGIPAVMATAIPAMEPVESSFVSDAVALAPSPAPIQENSAAPALSLASRKARPGWLIPLVIITGVVVASIFALAFWQARRR